MLNCTACHQRLGGKLKACPACGADQPSLSKVGSYEILECVAESRTASIYRARKVGDGAFVCLRLYDADVAISPEQEKTLRARFAALRELPAERFVHTLDFGHDDTTDRWFRVTPWLPNVMAWGDLKCEALYRNRERKRQWLGLALDLAESFTELHRIGRVIPDFTLDDCLLYRTAGGRLRVRLDATLASCLGPGSGREKVRDRHPDFAPGRTLSEQSDVWTLGSILVGMLKGTSDITDYAKAMDAINAERRPVAVHPELGALLRQMVDTDPAERPRGMKQVAEHLRTFGPSSLAEWGAIERDLWRRSRLARRIGIAVAAAALAVMALGIGLYQRQQRRMDAEVGSLRAMDTEARTSAVLTRYSRSVAFVLSECWLEVNGVRKTFETDKQVAVSSGTAFLVTEDGHLLTNRHVLQPWNSVASNLNARIEELRAGGDDFRVGANYWLWFDGDEAFRPGSTALGADRYVIEDYYRLDAAYSSAGGDLRVSVAGVKLPPADAADLMNSTLYDDVAVLKINVIPEGAVPIPLSAAPLPERGAGVLILGYSHGRSAIHGTRAAVRVARGAVSRVFADAIATDAATHGGNSGGPAVDLDGAVIGILTSGYMRDGVFQSGMGRLLPVAVAREFLDAVRAGVPASDGLPPEAFEPELTTARKAAEQGNWEVARELASVDGVLANPNVALAAAIYSMDRKGFTPEGRVALEHVTAMAPHFPFAALLRYWDAWRRGVPEETRPCRRELLEAEWWSPFEPYGYVAHLLDNEADFEQAAVTAENQFELALYNWAVATAAAKTGNRERAAVLLRAGLEVCHPDDKLTRDLLAASLWFEGGERSGMTVSTSTNTPPRFKAMGDAFEALVEGDWEKAASATDRHFETPRRENANTVALGLFRAQLYGLMGNPDGEKQALEAFRNRIANLWYRQIADALLGNTDPAALLATVAGKRHETLTLAVSLGLQAEARKDIPRALDHYRAALDTAQTNWLEFQLAQARRKALGRK